MTEELVKMGDYHGDYQKTLTFLPILYVEQTDIKYIK